MSSRDFTDNSTANPTLINGHNTIKPCELAPFLFGHKELISRNQGLQFKNESQIEVNITLLSNVRLFYGP